MEKTHNRLKGKNHKTECENSSLLMGQTYERLEYKREISAHRASKVATSPYCEQK